MVKNFLMPDSSYKLNIRKWQIPDKCDKENNAESKRNIQNEFKVKSRLGVDEPKPGYGCSNDGNTARKFFEKAEISSEISGIYLSYKAPSCHSPSSFQWI